MDKHIQPLRATITGHQQIDESGRVKERVCLEFHELYEGVSSLHKLYAYIPVPEGYTPGEGRGRQALRETAWNWLLAYVEGAPMSEDDGNIFADQGPDDFEYATLSNFDEELRLLSELDSIEQEIRVAAAV